MGRLDQGNKAQTPVGYSHGTRVYTDDLATAVTGVCPWVAPGEHVSGHTSSCRHHRCRLSAVDGNGVNQALCKVTGAWWATLATMGWCVSLVSGKGGMLLGGDMSADFVGAEGRTYMDSGGTVRPL